MSKSRTIILTIAGADLDDFERAYTALKLYRETHPRTRPNVGSNHPGRLMADMCRDWTAFMMEAALAGNPDLLHDLQFEAENKGKVR